MNDPILVIPLCGVGKRFKKVGYKRHKALLTIDKHNMLERIIGKFPERTHTYIITNLSIKKELELDKQLNKKNKLSKISFIIIDEHSLGPAYSIFKGFNSIPKGQPTYISYCDITWSWADKKFNLLTNDISAAIFCHYGFHPHLINNNYSAFCLPSKKDETILAEIMEKNSYTKNWMNEPLSIGLFYVKDIAILEHPLNKLIQSNQKIANEFFPSVLFNYLVKDKVKVNLIRVKNFVHYGTPLQFIDFKKWISFFQNYKKEIYFDYLLPAIILTSGKGSRMREISQLPKPLIYIDSKCLIEKVIESMPINNSKISLIFNSLSIPLSFLNEKTTYIKIKETVSQIESLFEIRDHIKQNNNFLICSCDCFGLFDQESFKNKIKSNYYDILCFGFQPSLVQKQSKSNYSTLRAEKEKVKKIFVKKIDSEKDFGLAGFFWIKNGETFYRNLLNFSKKNKSKKREIIIDDLIQYCIQSKSKVGIIELNSYIHLGTPDELKEYLYWSENYPSLINLN